ncbi:MAG: DUF3105 domain-containing protein [Actinomycetota bacterium]
MANKKRRRRPQERRPPRTSSPAGGGSPQDGAGAGPSPQRPQRPRADRQARKQQARAVREAQMRAQRRRDTARRFVVSAGVAAVAVGGFLFLTRVGGPNPFPQAAVDAASAAGCSDIQTPVADAPGGSHLDPGASYTYPQEPATSGTHDLSALSGDVPVYTEMPPETQLVHNLEHAFVNIYYRGTGDQALPADVVTALASVAKGDPTHHVILTPHTSLPDGVDLAVTAWNKLMTCPHSTTVDQATAIAQGFITSFGCNSNAPEPKAAPGC